MRGKKIVKVILEFVVTTTRRAEIIVIIQTMIKIFVSLTLGDGFTASMAREILSRVPPSSTIYHKESIYSSF